MREYVRVADMCIGTPLEDKPWKCVRLKGCSPFEKRHPLFNDKPEDYEFALAILEGKPVFVGDVLYSKGDRTGQYIVDEKGAHQSINGSMYGYGLDCLEYLTWTPPPRSARLR